jgi:hypothetical protein
MRTETEAPEDEVSGEGVCLSCLVDRVTELVGKLADAWWSEDMGDAEFETVDQALGELTDLLFKDSSQKADDPTH